MKLGVFGGTFNPVHLAHLHLADEAYFQAHLDHLLFLPNRLPPHKEAPAVDGATRADLLELALAGRPGFSVNRLELERSGTSYTIDTLEELSQDQRQLCFICGADAFDRPWHRLEEVLGKLWKLLLFHRHSRGPELPLQLQALSQEAQQKIEFLPFPALDISSSDLRERIAAGRPFRYLLPAPVHAAIVERGLYGYSG